MNAASGAFQVVDIHDARAFLDPPRARSEDMEPRGSKMDDLGQSPRAEITRAGALARAHEGKVAA